MDLLGEDCLRKILALTLEKILFKYFQNFNYFRGEFSYSKLEDKRSNRPGTFILRESESKYNTFYLDYCGKDSKPKTRRIEKLGPDDFALSDSMQRFKSIFQLIVAHKDPENILYLNECLPPSEYGL